MRTPRSGGGWPALWYALRAARRAGGLWKFARALRSRNACKTCALGMGGQLGGMVNEAGRFPEVCKKSMQAMAADMQGRIAREFWSAVGIAQLRTLTPRDLEHLGRLAEPVFAGPGDTHFRPVTWDFAFDFCARRFTAVAPDDNFFYASGRASNEAGFLLQLFARLLGTNNVNNCSYYCHQASSVGLHDTLGTGTATITLDDLDECDLFFLIGGNPASNHPRLIRTLVDLRRRGGQIIVVNPLREVGLVNFRVPSDLRSLLCGSPIASLYLQPHVGGDIALLSGVAKALFERDAADALARTFIDRHTRGFDPFRRHVEALRWDELAARSGVARDDLLRAADIYARSKAAVFGWTMGITHHLHGVDNVRAIVNLALLRGMVGRPGAGLLPIRGHSNVQGIGSVGVAPRLRDAVLARLESHFGVPVPRTAGLDTLAGLERMAAGGLRNAWCLGGNLFGASPDARWTAAALSRLESIVYLSTTLNTGHAWGHARHTLILPVRVRDEESQATTQESMFNYVRLSDGGPARIDGPRSEVEIIAEWGARVLGPRTPVDWESLRVHRNIRQAIAAIVPGYEAVGEIDRTGREFHVADRTLHVPIFRTPDGRARFRVVQLPALPSDDGALRLATIRSEGQFNTVVYEDEDIYRGQERRDVILMNRADIARLGLTPDQLVTVRSACGEMANIRVRPFDIRAGSAAMYGPEANILIPATADPESRTPAFKSILITLHPQPAPAAATLPVVTAARRAGPRKRPNAC
jgi:molybdopterin-dependent oxidoreductase alpha subunit